MCRYYRIGRLHTYTVKYLPYLQREHHKFNYVQTLVYITVYTRHLSNNTDCLLSIEIFYYPACSADVMFMHFHVAVTWGRRAQRNHNSCKLTAGNGRLLTSCPQHSSVTTEIESTSTRRFSYLFAWQTYLLVEYNHHVVLTSKAPSTLETRNKPQIEPRTEKYAVSLIASSTYYYKR